MAFDSYDMESLYTLFAYLLCLQKKSPYNLRSLIHKNICLQLKTSFFYFFSAIFEDSSVTPGCEASEWSDWSSCSVTCGKGISMRTRSFLMPGKAPMLGCDRQMVQKEMCSASVSLCEGMYSSFKGCVYCLFRAAGMYWDVGTCPTPFLWQIS